MIIDSNDIIINDSWLNFQSSVANDIFSARHKEMLVMNILKP